MVDLEAVHLILTGPAGEVGVVPAGEVGFHAGAVKEDRAAAEDVVVYDVEKSLLGLRKGMQGLDLLGDGQAFHADRVPGVVLAGHFIAGRLELQLCFRTLHGLAFCRGRPSRGRQEQTSSQP